MLFSQESERLALLDFPEWMLRPRRERDTEARAKLRASSAHARRRERVNGPAVAHRAQEPAAKQDVATRWGRRALRGPLCCCGSGGGGMRLMALKLCDSGVRYRHLGD